MIRLITLITAAFVTIAVAHAVDEHAADGNKQQQFRDRVQQLISELGDPQFAVREAAQAELARLGPEAFDALTIAENHLDLEIAARAHYLLGLIQFEWTNDDDPPEVKQALDDYDKLDSTARLKRIAELGDNLSQAQLTALCRLVRFEKSHLLSKQSALAIIEGTRDPSPEADQVILDGVANSPRSGAVWLRAFVRSHQEPEKAVDDWAALVTTEERVLDQTPERSRPEIVTSLLKQHVEQLKQLDRDEAALAVTRRIIEQESGQSESLVKLMRWLVDHRAWDALSEVEQRFSDRFGSDALLTYSLAEARLHAGDTQRADELAQQALEMNPGDGTAHYEVGHQLSKRGQVEWAEQELRHAIHLGPPESYSALKAQFQLADMMHDQQRDAEAGRLLQDGLATLERTSAEQGENNNGVDLRRFLQAVRGPMTARLNYYFACDAKAKNDRTKELSYLERAFEGDPLDADVLIALYRLPDPSDEVRRRTEQRIESAARQFRSKIADRRRDAAAYEQLASDYNQLAWLLSNTDRNQDDALRFSQESLKLRPNEPGLIDTLARCYYALGEFENAVRYQSKAVRLEPHSGQMRRQLELFEQALAQQSPADK